MKRIFVLLGILAFVSPAYSREDTMALFEKAVTSLRESHPAESINDLEALADDGFVDASVSFDRGLAYAIRVRMGGEVAGDLGRSVHGFEEARRLTSSPQLRADASHALEIVRSEIARRRARAGETTDLDPGIPLGRAFLRLLPENVWALMSVVATLALACGLTVLSFSRIQGRRTRAALACAVLVPVLLVSGGCAWAAREDRRHHHEAIVTSPSLRAADERGLALPGAAPIPEGALVQIRAIKTGWFLIRWGTVDGWIPTTNARLVQERP